MKTDSESPTNAKAGRTEEGHPLTKRLAAHIEIARTLSDSDSLKDVTPKILREISTALGFEIAILWRVDEDVLVCEEIWKSDELQAKEFVAKTRDVRLAPDVGLPGKVWTSKQPAWVSDIANHNLSITPIAAKENLNSAGCIPIKSKNEVLGVIELASRNKHIPDPMIEELMLAIGGQVGLFMERIRMAEALMQSEDRYRVLADTEPNVLVTIDEEFKITFVNRAVEKSFGYNSSELLGKSLTFLIPEYYDYQHALKPTPKICLPQSVALPGVHKNGTAMDLEVVFSHFLGRASGYSKSKKYATGVICDVTGKNRTAAALQESEAKMQKLLASNQSDKIIAEAPSMRGLIERVKKAAVSYAPILIQGETGSGKECVAHMIHHQSPLAAKPFVARNCAAIPASLFESEMFGHKKGSFTGADRDRKGAFLEADGGTLFLDEIGDLEYSLQTKLLRAIQEKSILPVGGDKDIPVNARIICATNKDLLDCAKKKEFREDLYYRLVTVLLVVPPLRERQEDILPLARHFIGLASAWTRTLSPEAEQRLLAYDWPGNVRELRSLMDQTAIFAVGNEIQATELLFTSVVTGGDAPSKALSNIERKHILQVLKDCGGNKTDASKVLGLARSTLVLKLKSYTDEKILGSK